MSNFTQTPEPVMIRPQRKIGAFSANMVVVDESSVDELEITEHPVQEGAVISDHAFLKPQQLAIKVVFGSDQLPLAEIYANLLNLQALREPFQVVTGKRVHNNMLMKTLSVTTDRQTENVLSVNFRLQEVIIVQVEFASVPPRAKQKSPGKTGKTENAGAKSAKDESKDVNKKRSVARSASIGIQSLFK